MPTLDELQRQWLDLAIQNKGKFTRKASIEKAWEDYRRRRDKVAKYMAGLLPDDPSALILKNALTAADELAEAGKFADAHKSLDQAKGLGKERNKDRALTLGYRVIENRLTKIDLDMGKQRGLGSDATRAYEYLFQRIRNMRPVSAEEDIGAASKRLKEIRELESGTLTPDLLRCEERCNVVARSIGTERFAEKLNEVERDIAVHISLGKGDEVKAFTSKLERLRTQLRDNNGQYGKESWWYMAKGPKRGEFETLLRAAKDMSAFRNLDEETDDDLTSRARGRLKKVGGTREGLEDDEERRLERVKEAYRRAGLQDDTLDLVNSTEVVVAPGLTPFDASVVFDGVSDDVLDGGLLPDIVPQELASRIVGKARDKLRATLSMLDAEGDQMFDLMVKSPRELAAMCGMELTGSDNPEHWTDDQKTVLNRLGEELRAEINKSSPNQMAEDKSKITVDGTEYTLVAVLGKGANGTVSRYSDGKTTVVVKSMNMPENVDAEDRQNAFDTMSNEMRTHRQMQQGVVGQELPMDNLTKMMGTAVDGDGNLHMMMEDVDGASMEDLITGYSLLTDIGVLPDEARMLISLDLVTQATKGLKSMQEVGLVHNDLKPGNMMVGKDGTLKIIDFGESRFVEQQTGLAPGPEEGNYASTPGYNSPEVGKRTEKVDGSSDNFGLSRILRVAVNRDGDQGVRFQKVEGEGSLGRLATQLEDPDPNNRPSLNAVLVSSVLTQVEQEAAPEEIKELQQAALETSLALKGLSIPVDKAQGKAMAPHNKLPTDLRWLRAFEMDPLPAPMVPMATILALVKGYAMLADMLRKDLTRDPSRAMDLRKELDVVLGKQTFWTELSGRTMADLRDEGRDEIARVENDETQTIVVPGNRGGEMTVKAAVALRTSNTLEIERLRNVFFEAEAGETVNLEELMNTTNVALLALDTQNRAITAAITALLGPKGRFSAAETRLVEMSQRFGRVDTGKGGTGPEPTGVVDEGELPPLPQGEMPDPPPLPNERVKEK